jgi:hypothetical protein
MRDRRDKSNGWFGRLRVVAVAALFTVSAMAQNRPGAEIIAKSPTDEVTDAVLFEDLKNLATHYYLPRYRIATQTVSGDSQYRVRFYKQGEGTILEIYLEKYPAPELGDAARTARELPHQIKVSLRYALAPSFANVQGATNKELAFQEFTAEKTGLKASLRLNTLREADELIEASKNASLNATLLVQRTYTVLTAPFTAINKHKALIAENDKTLEWIASLHKQCDPVLKEYGQKPPPPSAPQRVQIAYVYCSQTMTVQVPHEAQLRKQRANLEEELNRLREQRTAVTIPLDGKLPFYFDQSRHPYIFAGALPDPGIKPQLVRQQVSWQERYYSYFRPADRSDRWYYLPDRFVLAKQDQLPKLTVRFTGPPESQSVDLEYVAVPFTDPARLEAARAALGASSPVTMEPLVASEATLWAALYEAAAEGPFQMRAGASVDLRVGLKDQVRLSLEGFQKIYAALFNQSHTLFTGEVRLNPDGVTQERVPFEARVTDLSPEAFWDRAISQQVFADYQRTIQVRTAASVFAGDVKALIVVFKGGDDEVELLQDKLEAEVSLRTPMRDYILNTGGGGEYSYKVTTLRERNGKLQTTKTPTWRAGSDQILYPEIP